MYHLISIFVKHICHCINLLNPSLCPTVGPVCQKKFPYNLCASVLVLRIVRKEVSIDFFYLNVFLLLNVQFPWPYHIQIFHNLVLESLV
jgi:hypothetical protein